MQQFITSSEACALLDRILQTSQSLNWAINEYVRKDPLKPVIAAQPEPVSAAIVPEPVVLPEPPRAVAPVLTIKLSDLMQARDEARRRRTQRGSQPQPAQEVRQARPERNERPPQHRPKPLPRSAPRDVEVIYRRSVGRGLRASA